MKVRLFIVVSVFLSLFSVANAEQGNGILLASYSFGSASISGGARVIEGEDVLKLADFDEELVIFDVRKNSSRTKGKITWSEGLSSGEKAYKQLSSKIEDKETSIIVYGSRNSNLAARSAKKIMAQGYKNVYWFKGGWPEWKQKGLKIDL